VSWRQAMLLRGAAAVVVCVMAVPVGTAHADSCAKSRDYILASSADDLPRRPQSYLELYKICLQSLQLSNVKDAFVLKSGAIAVLPRDDRIPATAGTLAQFCTQHPRQMLRFITKRESWLVRDIARVVELSTSQSTSCQKITGSG
jgi:hypothetical protein